MTVRGRPPRRPQAPRETREARSIEAGGEALAYTLIRSGRRLRTVQLALEADGITVRAPMATRASDIEALLRRRVSWLRQRLASLAPPFRFADGAMIPFLGRDVLLALEPASARRVSVAYGRRRLTVRVPVGHGGDAGEAAVRASVERWYRERTAMLTRRAIARWAPRVGAAPVSWAVREQKRRWGSCSPAGVIRFNWRLSMLHPRLLDYVVVHELCHLLHPDHSPAFWHAVERVQPEAKALRVELRQVRLAW